MLLAAATEADKLNLDISIGTWAHPRRRHRRHARVRPVRLRARTHPERARELALVDRLDRRRARVRRRLLGLAGLGGRLAVPRRLPARALALARQHLRLRGDPELLRGARREGAGQGPGLGHHARARPAPDLHPARRGAAGRVPHHVLRLRRAAALHGVEARPPRRHRDRARAQPAAQAAAQAGHDDRRLRRRQAVHEGRTASGSRRRCSRSSW